MDKLDLVVDRIEDLKNSTETRLESIDNNLAEHMRRTDVLEQLHRDNQTRILKLEEPKVVARYIKNGLLYLAAICGAIISIIKLVESI